MILLYNIVLTLVLIIGLPFWIKRAYNPKYRGTIRRRLSLDLPTLRGSPDHPMIWIHAVSVGETLAARPLIQAIAHRFPDHRIALSTVTRTGQKIAREKILEADQTLYLPLDFSWMTARIVRQLRPSLVIIMETEIWPSLLYQLKRDNIPTVMVNGRLSDRSFKGYYRLRHLLRPTLNAFHHFCMQSQEDAQRMHRLGIPADRISHTGNIKYDQAAQKPSSKSMDALTKQIGPPGNRPVWLAASTHPGEEEQLLKVHHAASQQIVGLRMILVPRHPERADTVAHAIEKSALSFSRFSETQGQWTSDLLLVDDVGWLGRLYSHADAVFIGGTLIPHGGQNMLEPAAWSIPPIFGPHTMNFREAVTQLKENQACFQVEDSNALSEKLVELIKNPEQRTQMGNRARQVVLDNSGSLTNTLAILLPLIRNGQATTHEPL
ncbi:MAG: 3-deoxy-D-manno-octulosonic acid transferase [Magnetococcales bacterium]|nr:3-deoxy-D-manno-octulosonic acid transferase [Magnetococcales bacterium]